MQLGFAKSSHDLMRLAELAALSGLLSEEQNRLMDELYPLNIEARYPSHKDKLAQALNHDVCSNYITETEAMLRWIKKQL